jgi:hypothetical protein
MPAIRIKIKARRNTARRLTSTTLSGIHYDDLRQIFTEASIYCYDTLRQARNDGNVEMVAHYEQRLKVLKCCEVAMATAISASFPAKPARPPTKAERLAAVRESRRKRALFDQILATALQIRAVRTSDSGA